MKKFNKLIVALSILALSACAVGPRIDSLHDPEADFGKFTTYNFAPDAKVGNERYTSLLTKHLKYAISQEMESRGYRRSDNPDVLVNFNVRTKEKTDVQEMSAFRMPYYYSYRYGFYRPWPYYQYETRVVQYTQGTLNIDLIDAAEKQLVWEGVAVGRVREDAKENMRENVTEVVDSIFDKYPFVAGKAEPVATEK